MNKRIVLIMSFMFFLSCATVPKEAVELSATVGRDMSEMKKAHIEKTFEHLDKGEGYMLASTWLQCVAPEGPNHSPGGYGSVNDPGIRWWLEAIRSRYGPYIPSSPL